jgi:predicted nucleic acid-binding protein
LRVVLDTCILKLATFPAEKNAAALIYELARAGLVEAWITPAILEEYADVLGDDPAFVAEIVETFRVCYPLTELSVIRHDPDNRLLECALAVNAESIVTVNTAPGHFDRKQHQNGERGEARRIPERSGGGTTGEKAHSRLIQPSLRRFILRERLGASRVARKARRWRALDPPNALPLRSNCRSDAVFSSIPGLLTSARQVSRPFPSRRLVCAGYVLSSGLSGLQ